MNAARAIPAGRAVAPAAHLTRDEIIADLTPVLTLVIADLTPVLTLVQAEKAADALAKARPTDAELIRAAKADFYAHDDADVYGDAAGDPYFGGQGPRW